MIIRAGLALACLLAANVCLHADEPFAPEEWLRQHNLGRLTTDSIQSGKPLQPIAAKSLEQWNEERKQYLRAYLELIGTWPPRRPELKPVLLEEKAFDRWTRYKVSFATLPFSDAHVSAVRAWLLVPTRLRGPHPAIITLHQTIPQGKDEPAGIKTTLPWLAFATYYAERGYVTLAPDMIGYGERTSGGTERTGFEWADARPILDRQRDLTLLGLMLFDVSRCVDYLSSRPDVDPHRIGVVGHSLGGILVNGVLPLEPRLKVGVASCGYGLFRSDEQFPARWAAANSAYLPRLILYRNEPNALPLDFHHILALSAPRPQLIQTAMGDTIWTKTAVMHDPFVVEQIRRVRKLYGQQATDDFIAIEPIQGAHDRDHGWYPETQTAADALFAKVLKPERPRTSP
jgi:dienelactone hydrolase